MLEFFKNKKGQLLQFDDETLEVEVLEKLGANSKEPVTQDQKVEIVKYGYKDEKPKQPTKLKKKGTSEEEKEKKREYMRKWYAKKNAQKIGFATTTEKAPKQPTSVLEETANKALVQEYGKTAVESMMDMKLIGRTFEECWSNKALGLKGLSYGEMERLYELVEI